MGSAASDGASVSGGPRRSRRPRQPVRRPPAVSATLSYGLPPLGRLRGFAAVALRYGAFPAGIAMGAFRVLAGDTSVPGNIALVAGSVTAYFGLAGLTFGFMWRLRGKALRGVTFYLDEQPPLAQLNRAGRAQLRPLSQLRTIEVRYQASFADENERHPDDDEPSPWLRLSFEHPRTGRAVRYHLSPYFLNHWTLNNRPGFRSKDGPSQVIIQLQRLSTDHGIVIRDDHLRAPGRATRP